MSFLTASKALREIRAGRLTARELLESCLAQIERLEPTLKAWAYRNPEQARRMAEDPPAGALAGIPVGIKDVFNTQDMPTAMGSPIWAGFRPGNDARAVASLRQAGAVFPGKTITAELAVHTPGPTANPHNPDYSPGTSSSGSAAAVASGMVPLALGTQTAGSTLRPASYCGIYGFKPSFGLIPRTGILKTTDTLDTVGLLTRSAEDLELLFDTVRVHGRNYPLTQQLEDLSRRRAAPSTWRVAWVQGPRWNDAHPYARQALQDFSARLGSTANFSVEGKPLPSEFEQAHDLHATLYDKSLSYYFKQEFKNRTLVSPILKGMIAHGQQISLQQYRQALQRQAELAASLDRWFQQGADVLITLTTAGEAMKGLSTPDRPDTCLIWTLCGNPAVSLPVFTGPNRMPFGLQAVARRYEDLNLLRFVRALEQQNLIQEAAPPAHLEVQPLEAQIR